MRSHRTLFAAIKSDAKFARAVERANGASSYIPTKLVHGGRGWRECKDVTTEDYLAAKAG